MIHQYNSKVTLRIHWLLARLCTLVAWLAGSYETLHFRLPQLLSPPPSLLQRNKLARKPLAGAGVGGRGGVVVQESDLRSIGGMMDTEAERNRLLARSGYGYQPTYAQAHAQQHQGYASSGYQSDWRSDSNTPARTRVLSAHRQQRESGEWNLCW